MFTVRTLARFLLLALVLASSSAQASVSTIESYCAGQIPNNTSGLVSPQAVKNCVNYLTENLSAVPYSGQVSTAYPIVGNFVNISGTVSATRFVGDGSALTGIAGGGSVTVPGSTQQVIYNSNGSLAASSGFTYNSGSTVLNAGFFMGDGSMLTNISGTAVTQRGVFNVVDYGAKCDGVTIDDVAISNTIMAATNNGNTYPFPSASPGAARGGKVILPPGGVCKLGTINSPSIVINPQSVDLDCQGAFLDASGVASNSAVIAINAVSGTSEVYRNTIHSIRNCGLIGPSSKAASVTAILFNTPNTGKIGDANSRFLIENMYIQRFWAGTQILNNSYLITLRNIGWDFNDVAFIDNASGTTNSGENIRIEGGAMFNGGLGFYINNPNGDNYMDGTSIDYNTRYGDLPNGKLFTTNVHWEQNCAPLAAPPLSVGDSNGTILDVTGGQMLCGDGSHNGGSSATVVIGSQGKFRSNGLFINNTGMGTGTFAYPNQAFCTGPGVCEMRSTRTFGTSGNAPNVTYVSDTYVQILADPSFETPANIASSTPSPAPYGGILDLVSITSDTVPVVNRISGTNIVIAVSTSQAFTGLQSLAITKIGAAGTQAGFIIAAPLTPGYNYLGSIYYTKPGSQTGTLACRLRWAGVIGYDSNNIPVIGKLTSSNSLLNPTFTSSAVGWTGVGFADGSGSSGSQAPSYATHAIWDCNLNAMNAGTIYFDNFNYGRN